jgi:hypothetical protein
MGFWPVQFENTICTDDMGDTLNQIEEHWQSQWHPARTNCPQIEEREILIRLRQLKQGETREITKGQKL